MFGTLALDYALGRKGFPDETLDFILRRTTIPSSRILDIGCGTGIATRQLAARWGHVTGCDPDEAMLTEARRVLGFNINYLKAFAEELPFHDHSIQLITAFSAFHWFANDSAIKELTRVQAIGGRFAVTNKTECGDFEVNLRNRLSPFASTPLPPPKKDYDPIAVLTLHGSRDIEIFSIAVEEKFSRKEAISFLRSQSIWNLVNHCYRESALISLLNWVDSEIEYRGAFVRSVRVDTITCSLVT